MKSLGFVVSEKKILLCFSHCKSMGANDPRGGNGAIRNSHSENQCEENYIDNKVLGILREHFVI